MKNKDIHPMSIRIVEDEYSQTLMHVRSFELGNTSITATHVNGTINTANFQLPASIFVMISGNTVDHVRKTI